MTAVNIGCYPSFYNTGHGSGQDCPGPAEAAAPAEISNTTICDRWCGRWDTKQNAISSLFSLYRRQTQKVLRWYINWEGYLEWFEVGERSGIEYFHDTDNRIMTFNVTEDSSSIVNDMTGSYGEGDTAGSVHLTNATSITTYGLSVDDSINNSCMDATEMTAFLTHELGYKAEPVYNASMDMSGFYLIEPGKQIMFPDDDYYSTKIWTVVDWKFTDTGGKPVTSLNLTTDHTVISLPNEFEIIQSTAQKEVEKSLPEAATVTEVINDEFIMVTKQSDGSKQIVKSLSTS
jgi:hypothetical protein